MKERKTNKVHSGTCSCIPVPQIQKNKLQEETDVGGERCDFVETHDQLGHRFVQQNQAATQDHRQHCNQRKPLLS